MTKMIDFSQTVFDLANKHPEIIPILKELGFEQIAKPGMLHTAGRLMTIPNGCRMRGISFDVVKKTFMNNGFNIKE
ncbi:TPA: DUF1858 domain-containing protein [Bacillus cereus]|uniref:DUF1858 domain-containing protein n=1 Tax=Bacillus cereus group TaxID=86661 RepID=UPI0010404883|nr:MULTISPECIES: DUF1858 domain-containing protein [Bacillus cereus group]HDR7533982.1 DUF1858 domain-containing protein [Bacillus anthracis]KAA0742965.1 DUF1858 domain-containing protein [Bacillus sp. AY1-10]MCU4786707.1 DUF1858 domain-containing protein [Bacillus cereus]MCU5555298.1 DUF1858 domain-containing protein [Bacillus cereus]MCU5695828.1 DUF1858 domain-containing protein [Bacillus cereus]